MICEGCHVDKTATVLHTAVIVLVDSRSGRETRRTLSRRLCVACGGADEPEEVERPMTLAEVKPRRVTGGHRR